MRKATSRHCGQTTTLSDDASQLPLANVNRNSQQSYLLTPPNTSPSSSTTVSKPQIVYLPAIEPTLAIRNNWGSYFGLSNPSLLAALNIALASECLPICLLTGDLFRRDLDLGQGDYFSLSLLRALFSLSKMLSQDESSSLDDQRSSYSGPSGLGNDLSHIIVSAVQGAGIPLGIADTQAMGILAFQCASLGQTAKGLKLAGDFVKAASRLCIEPSLNGIRDDRYKREIASVYCGAVSLHRMLLLIQDYQGGSAESALNGGGVSHIYINGEPLTIDLRRITLDQGYCLDSHVSAADGVHLLAAKMFQLTEWVYKAQFQEENGASAVIRVPGIYSKCLKWYASLFEQMTSHKSGLPFIAFLHILYHFCILSLLTPFHQQLHHLNESIIHPQEICEQAARAILNLADSYDQIETPNKLAILTPSFVSAALFFLDTMKQRSRRYTS